MTILCERQKCKIVVEKEWFSMDGESLETDGMNRGFFVFLATPFSWFWRLIFVLFRHSFFILISEILDIKHYL